MLGIHRPRGALGMELDAQEWSRTVSYSLVRSIVGICEPRLPSLRQRGGVDSEAGGLRGDETAPGSFLETRLVVAAGAEFQLVGRRARRERQQLVPETDPHDRAVQPHGPFDILNRRVTNP